MSQYNCRRCGTPLNTSMQCPNCGILTMTPSTGFIYVEPISEVKIIMQQQETIAELQKRIDELEAQLAQVAKENDWMKYPEPPESGAK